MNPSGGFSSDTNGPALLGDKERALQRRFLFFASLLMVIIFGAAVVVLLSAAQRANDVEVRAGLRTINSILNNHIEELRGKALENAFWDDMVEQERDGFDATWVDDNIGEFLHETADLSLTVVIDAQDIATLIYRDGERLPPEPLQNMTAEFEDRLQALRHGALDPPDVDAGLLSLSGQTYVVGMTPISPEYPEPGYEGHDRAIMLLGRALTPERLSKIADDFGLDDLKFTDMQPDAGIPAIQQFDIAGRPLGWLCWTANTPGRTWLSVILPGLALAFLAVVILGVLLTQVWQTTLLRMREQERNLMIAVEEAINASRAKTVFLASMSHELRTPLNAVIGFSNILKAEMFGPIGAPKYLEYVGDINSTSNHLLKLIDSILDWAKLEAEQPVLQEETCSIANLFDQAITLADPNASDMEITTSIAPAGLAIEGDQTKLVQIITNLLTNAIKASETGQGIGLSSYQEVDGSIRVDVTDRGKGISEEVMKRLFQPFQRSSDPYRTETTGIGLGLVVSMRLAELHQGSISLKSAESGGTVASLMLPAERAVGDQEGARPTPDPASAL